MTPVTASTRSLRTIVEALETRGVRALNPSMGFPMEMDRFPGKIWVVSHKPIAVAAGLGQIDIHRNVIHPKFGSFVLLGCHRPGCRDQRLRCPARIQPLPGMQALRGCLPTGAIGADGQFDFSACYTHNYREFMGGFTDWVEQIADGPNARAYRRKVTDAESASMWQSLSFGANYKAAYCLAVCPAGEDVIKPFPLIESRSQQTSSSHSRKRSKPCTSSPDLMQKPTSLVASPRKSSSRLAMDFVPVRSINSWPASRTPFSEEGRGSQRDIPFYLHWY